jgi:hypothetical protein
MDNKFESTAISLLAFCLIATIGFGQTSNKQKRFQVGIHAAPEVCYRSLYNNDSSQQSAAIITLRNGYETVKLGYTGGLDLVFNLNSKFGFQAGLQLANRGYSTKKIDIESTTIDPIVPQSVKYNYHFYYLEIPAKVNYSFGQNRMRLSTSAGLSSAFLIKQNNTYIGFFKDSTTRQTLNSINTYKPFNIIATISAGIEYQLSPLTSFKIEPTFRYGLLNIIDAPISGHVYSGGVNVSYLVRF